MSDAWGISWRGLFKVWSAYTPVSGPPDPVYEPPFLDFQLALRTSIGNTCLMPQTLSLSTLMPTMIERQAKMGSSRIDRSVM